MMCMINSFDYSIPDDPSLAFIRSIRLFFLCKYSLLIPPFFSKFVCLNKENSDAFQRKQ